MKDHGKLNAQLLSPEYWTKAKLPDAAEFAQQFQDIDAKELPENDRKAALDELVKAMSMKGYNNPANPVYTLMSAILVQRN